MPESGRRPDLGRRARHLGMVLLGGVVRDRADLRIPLPAFGDAVAPGIVLASRPRPVGQIYFNQELYGRETTPPCGMEIFIGVIRRDGRCIPSTVCPQVKSRRVVQPTFLYELI